VCNSGFIDPGTRRRFGNPVGRSFEEIFRGFAEDELTAVDALIDRQAWIRWRLEMHRKPPREPIEIQWTDGRWMRVTERRTAEGGYVGIWTDITAIKAAETRLRDAIESIPEGFVLLDSELKIKIFNRRMLDLYPNSAPAFAVGQSFHEVLRFGAQRGEYPGVSSYDEVGRFVRQWMDRFRSSEPYFGEGAFHDGRWVLVSHRRTGSGDYVSIRTDITAQKQRERELANLLQELIAAQSATEKANESLERNSALLRAITDAVPALVAYVDREERYQYCNDEYRDILGVEPSAMVGRHIAEIVEPEIYHVVKPQIERVLAGTEVAFVRPMLARGATRYVEQRYIPHIGLAGSVDGFYAIAWDVTESHNREEVLSREAVTDPLTGLLNRRGMTDILVQQAQRWRDGESQGAVLFLDIDRFKHINDTLGHDVGDQLLKVFAERLRGVIRSSDTLARLGGDEFVILLSAPDAEEIARRVAQNVLERVRQPVSLNGRETAISTSIGIAVVKPNDTAGDDEILKQADTALYEAKAAGRDRYAVRQTR
jgi:diguanylate cyclase (GGDEF)-like protein/PAS domain S-box-containing protein